MVVLPEHSHCVSCGDPCGEDESFCGPVCAEEYALEKEKSRKKDIVFWVGVSLAIGGLVFMWFVL